MRQKYFTIITDKGLAKEAEIHGSEKQIDLTHVVIGDGNGSYYDPISDMTNLKNTVYKAEITKLYINEKNGKQVVIEAVIPDSAGDFYVREVGIIDGDGDLFAIGNYPETYKPRGKGGYAKELYLRIIIGFSSTQNINIRVGNASFVTPKDLQNLATNNLSNVSSEDIVGKLSDTIAEIKSPVGSVFAYMGNVAPNGYLFLDGASIGADGSDANYMGKKFYTLYKLLVNDKTKWEDLEKVHIPDCRSRCVIGAGQTEGLSDRILGGMGGEENHTLSAAEMPHHTHNSRQYLITDTLQNTGTDKRRWEHGFHSVTHQGDITSAVGGNQPHNNMQPWIAMNYIIKY